MSGERESSERSSEESTVVQGQEIAAAGEDAAKEIQPQEGFRQLDPAAVVLWRIESALSIGIPLLGALIGGVFLWILTPVPWWVVPLVWVLLVFLLILNTVWLPARKYAAWSYRLDDRVLELRNGVFWKRSVMIPLTRLQHVDLSRGPLERRFGVASLEVFTAGTQSASHEIPHLQSETGFQLREDLVEAAGIQGQ
jgi:membrane protein YdbS with pleckstrin-like domain